MRVPKLRLGARAFWGTRHGRSDGGSAAFSLTDGRPDAELAKWVRRTPPLKVSQLVALY